MHYRLFRNNKVKNIISSSVLTLTITVVLGITGCRSEATEPQTEVRPAPIHEVRVSIAESYPPQVFVYIKGGLSDSCTIFHDLTTERKDNTINITVTTERPKDTVCAQVYSYFEKNVALGSDFKSGETYALNVNDYKTSFVMQ